MPSYLDSEVQDLYEALLLQYRFPEMFRLSRYVTQNCYITVPWSRVTIDMDTLIGSDPTGWYYILPPKIRWALSSLDLSDNTVQTAESRSVGEYYGSYGPLWILRSLPSLNKQLAFVVQMANAYLDLTRTHGETFFNMPAHQEMSAAMTASIYDVNQFLNSAT